MERAFFNKPYLFVTAVFDNGDNADFRYVRPEGAYYESVKGRGEALKTSVTPSRAPPGGRAAGPARPACPSTACTIRTAPSTASGGACP